MTEQRSTSLKQRVDTAFPTIGNIGNGGYRSPAEPDPVTVIQPRPHGSPTSVSAVIHDKSMPNKKTKTKGDKPVTYYTYRMIDPVELVHIKGCEEALDFQNEHGNRIKNRTVFLDEAKWEKHKKSRADKEPEIEASPNQIQGHAALPGSAQRNQIFHFIAENVQSDSIIAYHKTTSSSRLAVIIIEARDRYNAQPWFWAPDILVNVLHAYGDTIVIPDVAFKEACKNMRTAPARDPNDSNKFVQLKSIWKTQGNTIERKPVFLLCTHITLPIAEINSKNIEDQWLPDKTMTILAELCDIMDSDYFHDTMLIVHPPERRTFIHKIYDPKKNTNFPKYLRGVQLKNAAIVNLANHVSQQESENIMELLSGSSSAAPKYDSQRESNDR